MQDIQYIGEHLLPGRLGHFFVVSAFVTAILAFLSFRKATLQPDDVSWRRMSRWSWGAHTFSIFSVIGLIFYMMTHQMYEYKYVWDHTNDSLPFKYIFSAFWEGQEGSFLLWMFWHVNLGIAVLFLAKKWAPGVMTWLSLIQAVLVSMIAGIYFADKFKMGSNPFSLLRDTLSAPIFSRPDYLTMIEGNGLNPLLQNYWMTIHPPTLFLGFASVSIPFCFAMTGLWLKDHTGWLKPAMPWTLFSAGILGTGVLMGGAWAYEALSFGGYWAWDPVENMSLVPWLILLAGLHANFISRHTNHSIKTTYIFYLMAFLLVVYSTFLTRSGILGEESVHAFTQMGLEWQLVGFIFLFLGLGTYFILSRNKSIPVIKKEELMQSREFWMFVGALILAFSSILISFTTSIPVWNKLIDVYGSIVGKGDMTVYHKAMPIDPVDHHNRFQLWIAVLVTLISSVGQVLRFNAMGWETHKKRFWKHMAISAAISLVLSYFLSLWINLRSWQYVVLLLAASFGFVCNLGYIVSFVRQKFTSWASPLSHAGFALMVIGIMVSGLNKRIISENRFAQEGLAEGLNAGENAFLIKGMPMYMNGFWVTYHTDTLVGLTRLYTVEFLKLGEKGDTLEHFTTHPDILYDRKMTKVATANPNTKRYLDRDVFTYVAGLPPEKQDVANVERIDSALDYKTYFVQPGDSIQTDQYMVRVDSVLLGTKHPGYEAQENDLVVSADIAVHPKADGKIGSSDTMSVQQKNTAVINKGTQFIHPTLFVRKGLLYGLSDQVNDYNLRVRLKASAIDSLLPLDENLRYEPLVITQGGSIHWKDLLITMKGIDKKIDHPNYTAQEGDIAIQGVFEVTGKDGIVHSARPLYFIRDGQGLNMKAYIPDLALHLRIESIDPKKEEFHLYVAKSMEHPKVAIEVAEKAPRNDYIVLEAILFPGINLFWAGSLIMLFGIFLGLYKRIRQ
jgi:cytochrome c-type biogenesis protein CcmF